MATARGFGEMRLEIGTADVQPAIQFTNSVELGSVAIQAVGPTITANGVVFMSGAGVSIAANAQQYMLMRYGWYVKNTDVANWASCYIGGGIDVWGGD